MSQTVARAIQILEYCSEHPRTLKDIAADLGVHRTTASRILQTMIEAGFVRTDERGNFGVGFRLAGLAQSALEQFDLRSVVHPHIVRLSEQLGHTVQFAVPEANRIVYVDKVEPEQSISLNTRIGGFVVIHTAGVSKAILAFIDDTRREAILDNATFEQRTPNSITSRSEFVKRLETVRARGWAEDNGEFDIVSNCIAAPVWDHADRVAGAISITTFREKTGLDELRRSVPDLLATTMSISLELGWKPKGETVPPWAKATG
ncbi:IclR family transcriptional regulator [Arthrobacter sp. efr-133-TYG-118]|jgi:DNA-binding IclR family transcriptional regulator|uniref:IclR family transcriptional regulator n=1 Tax=Arthrobacter sp. efr-133-TYG-118 TaxID=3040279 RepID=UPI00254BAB1F|nr:IclR family transcriptional regulator [Arthrobacter sp. efr-133-TYG-118]